MKVIRLTYNNQPRLFFCDTSSEENTFNSLREITGIDARQLVVPLADGDAMLVLFFSLYYYLFEDVDYRLEYEPFPCARGKVFHFYVSQDNPEDG